jgi:hypothetical protein
MKTIRCERMASVLLVILFTGSPVYAVFIGNSQGGTDFPQGPASFADQLADYSPVIQNGQPTDFNRQADKALGVPDYLSGGGCTSSACTFVSLGDGGSITLRFTDNVLTGSDSSDLDLWIFEVGPDIEDTFVDVSSDGSSWIAVGKVFGSTAGIDVDAYGFGASSSFAYVRLTDDGNEGDQTGISAGADIDAVGAISTRIVPEPATLWSLLLALGCFGAARRAKPMAGRMGN